MSPVTFAGRRPAPFAILALTCCLMVAMTGCAASIEVTQSPSAPASPATSAVSAAASIVPSMSPLPTPAAGPSLGPLVAWAGRDWHRFEPREVDGEHLSGLFLPFAANGMFVAQVVGDVHGWWRTAYSTDGRTWHFARMPAAVCCEVTPMAFGNGHWLALTYTEHLEMYGALTSPDGRDWDFVPGSPLVLGDGSADSVDASSPRDLAWHRGSWYALISRPKLATDVLYRSTSGTDWSLVTTFPAEGFERRSMESDGTTLVITQVTDADGLSAWASTDGMSWERHALGPGFHGMAAVEAARGRWIALADSGDGPGVWWSSDGTQWYEAAVDGGGAENLVRPIVLADGFLAINRDGEPWASSDGREWAAVEWVPDLKLRVDAAAETRGMTLLTGYLQNRPIVWIGESP